MLYLTIPLLVLSRAADDASVEDMIRDLPRVRRGGRRRGFFGEIGKGLSNVGNTIGGGLQNAGKAIGNTWDNGVDAVGHAGQTVGQWGQDAVDWLNPFDCETKAEFTDCKNIGTSNRNWMSRIPDHKKITELSIPGTHDSAALHGGGAPWHTICNSLTISQQLDAGIRYLDIRPRHFNDALPIHHGQVFQHEYFSGVLQKVRQFLQQNPTETIFIAVQKEHTASGNTRSFNEIVADVINWDLGRYGLLAPGYGSQPWQLTMGQVRGKVIFIQAFSGNFVQGSIASSSNLDYHGTVTQTVAGIPNFWEINYHWQLDAKRNAIQQNLDQARSDPWRLYVNHLSGTGVSFGGIKQVAKPMNAHARNLMASRPTGSGFGIIVADFPGASLITDIIYKNPTF